MARRRYPQEAYPGMPTNDPAPSLGGSFPPLGGPGYGGSGGGGGVDQSGMGAGPVAPAPVPLYQVPAPLASTTAASPLSGAPVATTGVASPWGVPAYPVGQQPSGGGGVASPFAAGGPLVGAPPPHGGGGFSPSPPTAGPGSTGVVGGAGPAYPSLETPSLYSAYPETATLGFYGGSGGAPPPSGPPTGGPPLQPTGHPTTAGTAGVARRHYPVPDFDAEGGPSSYDSALADVTQMAGSMHVSGGVQTGGAPGAGLYGGGPPQPARGLPVGPTGQQVAHPVTPPEDPSQKPDPESACPSCWMRMTVNAVPSTPALGQKAAIPLGCILQPMAPSDEHKIPVVNFGRTGIIRCRKCRAYINPFVNFLEGGRRWRCNLCDLVNETPNDYFSELDRNGRRKDWAERAELSKGCVEFVAPSEYMVRRPMPPTYFFVIDVSYYSVSSGMLQTLAETVKKTLDNLPDTERTNVGFITFDSSIHFYNLKSSLSQPRMLVVSDVEDVFLPLPDDMLVNLKDSRSVVDTLLDRLPAMHAGTQNVESALGPALKAAWNVMRIVGGKMLLFLSRLPSVGFASLKMREDPKLLGTDKEVALLKPDNQFYKDFALDCSRQQIAVDLFLFSPHYTDVATLSVLPQFTSGQTIYYPAYNAEKDAEKFAGDLTHVLTRETGWEAVMRVRATHGVKVSAHYGNLYIRSTDLMALPTVDSDKAFAVQLQVDSVKDPLNDRKYVSIQNALLYTTSQGERRIRVATVCLPVTSSLSDLFKFADVDAVVALTSKMAVEKVLMTKLSDARQAVLHKCIDILSVYRASFASAGTSSTQLVLPESLKLLPLYTLALIKHIALRSGADIKPDERSYHLALLRTLGVSDSICLLYPRLYQLNVMPAECGTVDESGKVVLPPVNNLSSEKLDQSGIFLLDDGQYLLLWVGKLAAPEAVHALFGVPSLFGVDDALLKLVDQGNDFSQRVVAIVNALRASHPCHQKLYVVREGDPLEYRFFAHFVEDNSKTLPSYYEFLCQLQRQVQTRAK